jgi:dihydroorotate dehydrogenase (NAD+) catalytic subunit
MSGVGILPLGLKVVRDIREACPTAFINGQGGIRTARDVLAYFGNGANAIGIGTACAGMDDWHLQHYFPDIIDDCRNGTNNAEQWLCKVDTEYRRVRVARRIDHDCDFKTIVTDSRMENAGPGSYLFAWIPGISERPFSIVDDNPLTLTVLTRGPFTKALNELEKGDAFYYRGPYGKPVTMPTDTVALVGGGCGIAGIYHIAKHAQRLGRNVRMYLAAKDANHLPLLEEFERFGEVFFATEDGSLGEKGLVTDLLKKHTPKRHTCFFNCGPARMVEAVLPIEKLYATPQHIYSSLDYMTRCGIGICGSCADRKGRRTCVEGPFMRMD